jgi:hypothetical protein
MSRRAVEPDGAGGLQRIDPTYATMRELAGGDLSPGR